MKWRTGYAKVIDKALAHKDWERWFAWWPVRSADDKCVWWLVTIERRVIDYSAGNPESFPFVVWEYREIK